MRCFLCCSGVRFQIVGMFVFLSFLIQNSIGVLELLGKHKDLNIEVINSQVSVLTSVKVKII